MDICPQHRPVEVWMIRNTKSPKLDIYGGRDPREIPAYRVTDAASYLGIPVTTLRAWSSGMSYAQRDGRRGYFKPVFSLPDSDQSLLSYFNLVEAFVLSSLRKKHLIKLSKIRTAIGSLRKRFNSAPVICRRGWVIISHDQYNELEKKPIRNAGGRAFLIVGGNATGDQKRR